MPSFYVTTPIYYVNSLPHIGHLFSTVAADVVARYRRLAGDDVWFLTGTDEHGQKIERAAAAAGFTPQAHADAIVGRYQELWRRFGISHDDFLRTTEARHRRGVEEIIDRIAAAGDLYTARHEGFYCVACEAFYTEKELLPGNRCPVHESVVEWRSEDNVFFRLSRYERRLLDWYDSAPRPVEPVTRWNEVRSFVAAGLRDLSVSRANLDWGIPFPGQPGQTVYVWLDALTNYISALGWGSADQDLYRRFWTSDGERLHLIGKDILRFHAVYWPAFLMSAGLPLPSKIWTHGFWLRDERKMSKSTGNVVRPDHLVERFGPDVVRYYLLRDMVFGQDASFSDEAFIDRFNSDLANDLGNTVSRVVTLSRRAFDGKTPPVPCDDSPVRTAALALVPEYRAAMDALAFSRALEALWRILAEANQYLVAREPWKLIKSEGPTERLSRVLWNGLEAVRFVATGLLPFMPTVAPRVLRAIGVGAAPRDLTALRWGLTPTGQALDEAEPLFPRVDRAEFLAALTAPSPPKDETMISIDQFAAIQMLVGTVRAAERVAKSEKLLRLEVDLGEAAPRQVVAGIGKHYDPAALVGTQVVVVANLEPAKLMGVESRGMVLAASRDGVPTLLRPVEPVPEGTPVR